MNRTKSKLCSKPLKRVWVEQPRTDGLSTAEIVVDLDGREVPTAGVLAYAHEGSCPSSAWRTTAFKKTARSAAVFNLVNPVVAAQYTAAVYPNVRDWCEAALREHCLPNVCFAYPAPESRLSAYGPVTDAVDGRSQDRAAPS